MTAIDLHGVLWDMDGVLVDTGELHYHAWKQALLEFGLPFSRALFEATFGMNNTNTLAVLLGEKPAKDRVTEIGGRKEALFRESLHSNVQPAPGAVRWLTHFRTLGLPQALASSAPMENIDTLMDELELRPFFTTLVSGAELPGKPDPTIFLEAASRLATAAERCLVFEDAPAGVRAAKQAGMRCIALTTTHPAAELQEANLVVNGLVELTQEMVRSLFP